MLSFLVAYYLIRYICHVKRYGTLHRLLVWLSRLGQCRGFGVQSPWAYNFVRYVINEHWPFYSYRPLRYQFPQLSRAERKTCEFMLRLANFSQPEKIVSLCCGDLADKLLEAYFAAGCKKTGYVVCSNTCDLKAELEKRIMERPIIVVIDAASVSLDAETLSALGSLADGDYVVALDINAASHAKKNWQCFAHSMERGLTFDLYYAGVAYIDRKRYREHFKINF